MNSFLITDLHLTDNPRDEYRWGLFPWIVKQVSSCPFQIDYGFILGDLTVDKNYHSAVLVNRITDSIAHLVRETKIKKLYVLRGNHDGIDPTCSYFRFLSHLPHVQYVDTQWVEEIGNLQVLMLPHTRKPEQDWAYNDFYDADIILMHATVEGAVAENDQVLPGVNHSYFRNIRADIYSGDIHVPQVVGKVTYIGAPYPIRFGDKFSGGALFLKKGKIHSKKIFPSLRRWMLDIRTPKMLDSFSVQEGDQCKVRLLLTAAEYLDWEQYKKQVISWCTEKKIELCGIELAPVKKRPIITGTEAKIKLATVLTPEKLVEQHCSKNKLGQTLCAAGFSLVQGL